VNCSFKLRTDASTYLKLKHAIRHENFGVLTIKHDLKCLTAFMKWLVFNKKIHTYSLKHGFIKHSYDKVLFFCEHACKLQVISLVSIVYVCAFGSLTIQV